MLAHVDERVLVNLEAREPQVRLIRSFGITVGVADVGGGGFLFSAIRAQFFKQRTDCRAKEIFRHGEVGSRRLPQETQVT